MSDDGFKTVLGKGEVLPIESEYRQMMNNLANAIDELFNGPDCPPEKKQVAFVLLTANFGVAERTNYISNANRADMVKMLEGFLERAKK